MKLVWLKRHSNKDESQIIEDQTSHEELREFVQSTTNIDSLYQTPDEFKDYVNEIWEKHYENEQELNYRNQEHAFDMRVIAHEMQNKIDWIQNKTSFYINCLEAALNDTKISKDREINRLMQVINDMEGHKMREIIPDAIINKVSLYIHILLT